MEELKVNEIPLAVKEYQDIRVVTFKDIDMVHGRPDTSKQVQGNQPIANLNEAIHLTKEQARDIKE